MISRKAESYIAEISKYFPVIAILGPRQSGKTTLSQLCFPNYDYCSLEDPDNRSFAELDPRGFLDRFSGTVIIDEVQRVPELLSYIQTIVDKKKKKADFILTGSHQPLLTQAISQSLVGRIGILHLFPFSFSEIPDSQREERIFDHIFKGFYPALFSDNTPPPIFFPNYYETYFERDLRQLINLKNTRQFQIFVRLLAGRVGQLVNYNALAADSGVSNNTIREWISILEASYLLYSLPPYFKNIRKRLVKSPKLYFTDTGLLCYLLGINTKNQLERDPLRGNIFENFVVMDVVKELYHRGKEANLYFLRDSKGFEIDMLYEQSGKIKLFEIKSSATWNLDFHKNLELAQNLFHEEIDSYLVYSGSEKKIVKRVNVLPAQSVSNVL